MGAPLVLEAYSALRAIVTMRAIVALAIVTLAFASTDGADYAPEMEFDQSSFADNMDLLDYEFLIQRAPAASAVSHVKALLAKHRAMVKEDMKKIALLRHKHNVAHKHSWKTKAVSVKAGNHAAHAMLKTMKHRLKRWKKRAGKAKKKKKFTPAQIRMAKRAAKAAQAAVPAEAAAAKSAHAAIPEEVHLKGVTGELWAKEKTRKAKAKHPKIHLHSEKKKKAKTPKAAKKLSTLSSIKKADVDVHEAKKKAKEEELELGSIHPSVKKVKKLLKKAKKKAKKKKKMKLPMKKKLLKKAIGKVIAKAIKKGK